jgi:hypothetical protein
MHKNGGLVFFVYVGDPYLKMNLNGKLPDEYRKKLILIINYLKKI